MLLPPAARCRRRGGRRHDCDDHGDRRGEETRDARDARDADMHDHPNPGSQMRLHVSAGQADGRRLPPSLRRLPSSQALLAYPTPTSHMHGRCIRAGHRGRRHLHHRSPLPNPQVLSERPRDPPRRPPGGLRQAHGVPRGRGQGHGRNVLRALYQRYPGRRGRYRRRVRRGVRDGQHHRVRGPRPQPRRIAAAVPAAAAGAPRDVQPV
mmetsp:Transcript_17188/g.39335  ORF Transcript_17188/g.39335 Transcript_17188/m.39335 type:complete len:208 (-) Transcript_17188:426-1049(-)